MSQNRSIIRLQQLEEFGNIVKHIFKDTQEPLKQQSIENNFVGEPFKVRDYVAIFIFCLFNNSDHD